MSNKWKIVSNFVAFSKYLNFIQDYLAGNKLHWTTFYLIVKAGRWGHSKQGPTWYLIAMYLCSFIFKNW